VDQQQRFVALGAGLEHEDGVAAEIDQVAGAGPFGGGDAASKDGGSRDCVYALNVRATVDRAIKGAMNEAESLLGAARPFNNEACRRLREGGRVQRPCGKCLDA
jgi:hypothetical protein